MPARISVPAFPRSYSEQQPGDRVEFKYAQDGMDLRDYLAAKALSAILPVTDTIAKRRGEYGVQALAHDYAQIAYAVADAMMKERAK